MSQFEQAINQARQKQLRLYLLGLATVLFTLLIIVVVIIATRGIRIEVKPDEITDKATITITGGIGFIMGNTLYSVFNEPDIIVEAEGFYSRQEKIHKKDFGKVVTITLKPLPANIILRTHATDAKTTWLVNNQLYIQSNELISELEAGEYSISVMHPYYEVKELTLTLSRGQQFEQMIELQPVSGEIKINTSPADVEILLNDELIGETPLLKSSFAGEYSLKIRKEGFEPITETIIITREKPVLERNYHLLPEKGKLNLNLEPEGGKLLINKIQTRLNDSYRLEVNQDHQLVYSKPGYISQTKTFRVSTDKTLSINIKLQQDLGKVQLRSSPEGATVIIDSETKGKTPVELLLPAVEQVITFTKPGYRTVAKKILPTSTSTKLLEAYLIPEQEASLQEAPSSYKHKAGGTLLLFKPNDRFTMGASRDEPGQRANEFLRQVQLTRPFYAGMNEVTNSIYQQYDQKLSGKPNEPVTGVSWFDAIQFCNWLSREEGLKEVYQFNSNRLTGINRSANGYRLLTEAEWEWLARKVNRNKETRFVWGDNTVIPKNTVNVADESAKGAVKSYVPGYNDGQAGVAASGSYNKELSGLFDQGGNVSEWVHDSYSLSPPKKNELFLDPFDMTNSDTHVIKGANWRSGTITTLRAAYREGLSSARDDVGFRVGRNLY